MKRTILLLLTLSLILGIFSSCNHKTVDPIDDQTSSSPSEDTSAESTENVIDDSTESNETNQSENTETEGRLTDITEDHVVPSSPSEYNYTVEKVGDQWYMVFDTYLCDPMYGQIAHVPFETDSMKNVKQIIFGNKLGEWEKERIVSLFEHDEIGIPIPDMLNPILPEGVCVYQVLWLPNVGFVSSFMDENYSSFNGIDGAMYVIDETEFMERYNIASKENIYVAEDGEKTIVILQVKNEYVDQYFLYVKIRDNYVYFKINGLPENPDKDLIMSFGFEVLT